MLRTGDCPDIRPVPTLRSRDRNWYVPAPDVGVKSKPAAVVVAIVFHVPHFPPGGWKRDCTTDAKPVTGVEVTVTA